MSTAFRIGTIDALPQDGDRDSDRTTRAALDVLLHEAMESAQRHRGDASEDGPRRGRRGPSPMNPRIRLRSF